MEQPCSNCGYVSDRPARFCRQCGNALFAENEATSATTRSYDPNQAPHVNPQRSSYTPNYVPGQGLDEPAHDTSRFYSPPVVQNAAPYYQAPQPRKSRAGLWILIAVVCFLFAGVGIAGMFYSANRVREQIRAARNNPASELEDQIREQVEESIRRAQEAASEAAEQAREAAEAAREAGIPPPPPPPAGLPNGTSPWAEKYRYPKATINQSISLAGSEIVKMSTDHSADQVADFYQKLIGQPPLNRQGQHVIFQITGSPSTIITISPDGDHQGNIQIVLLRSHIQLPKFN